MRSLSLVLLAFVVASAAMPRYIHSKPHRLDKNESVEHEISEALKDIESSRMTTRMTMTIDNSDPVEDETPTSFLRNIEDMFSSMYTALQNTNVPFFSEHHESVSAAANETANKTTRDLLSRTRTELKQDIEGMRFYLDSVSGKFNEWMVSSRHQDVKSMLIGGLSAVVVLVAYYFVCKCCRRRSRMNHLAAFANDGFESRHGETEGLLPTGAKKGHRFPSNSDEDI